MPHRSGPPALNRTLDEPNVAARARHVYLMLVVSFAMMGASLTLFEVNFPSFLRERFGVGEWFRGFLEFPRESQGFAVVFYVVILGGLTERRLFSIAAILSGLGLVGLALVPAKVLADGASGILPGLPMILMVMIHSAGFHLGATMQRCIILDHGQLADAGARLGKVGFWCTLAGLAAAAFVWGVRKSAAVDFSFFFLCAAGLAFGAVVVTQLALRRVPAVRPPQRRLVLKRKFLRYYALCALFGVRKQVFITFALWVLVTVYHQPVETIALLWVITMTANLVTQPWIGWLIDRFGPRRVLTVDAVCLVAVCLLYGYSETLFPAPLALFAVGLIYVCDHVLFFVGAARAVYVGAITDDSQEMGTTLSMGMTIDHIFSMSVPFLGGVIWKVFGYEAVFLVAAGIGCLTVVTARGIPDVAHAHLEGASRLAP